MRSVPFHPLFFTVCASLAFSSISPAQLRVLDNYSPSTHFPTDDSSTDAVAIGFEIKLFGSSYSDLYVNNNGNVTFLYPSGVANPLSISGGLAEQGGPVLAPFFADVDTTHWGEVTFGAGTIGSHNAFVVNWSAVAAFGSGLQQPPTNTFQLFLVERADLGAGNFDFEFNYHSIQWDRGATATVSALAGAADSGMSPLLLNGSGVDGAFLDGGPATTALIHNSLGTPFDGQSALGRYTFNVREGVVAGGLQNPGSGGGNPGGPDTGSPVPEPSTYGLGAISLLFLATAIRRAKLQNRC